MTPITKPTTGRPNLDGAAGVSAKRQVRLGQSLDERLRARAAAEDRELSELIRDAIRDYLDRSEDEAERNFDPMLYDVMREVGTQLSGRYLALERSAQEGAEAQRWREMETQHWQDVRAVDARSRKAVLEATEHFREKLQALPSPGTSSHVITRGQAVEEALHSGEMEGLFVSPEGRGDAEEYSQGRISVDELVARRLARYKVG